MLDCLSKHQFLFCRYSRQEIDTTALTRRELFPHLLIECRIITIRILVLKTIPDRIRTCDLPVSSRALFPI